MLFMNTYHAVLTLVVPTVARRPMGAVAGCPDATTCDVLAGRYAWLLYAMHMLFLMH